MTLEELIEKLERIKELKEAGVQPYTGLHTCTQEEYELNRLLTTELKEVEYGEE